MRRQFTLVAVAAAALLAPSTALAAPVITGPPSPTATNAPVVVTWSDADVALEASYNLVRGDVTATPCEAAPVNPVIVAGPIAPAGPLTASDTPPNGTYCYYVEATDLLMAVTDSAPVEVTYDTVAPTVTAVTQTGGDGCTAPFTITGATASEPASFTVDALPFSPGYIVPGAPYAAATAVVVAKDAAGNLSAPFAVAGQVQDTSTPGPSILEVTTDPTSQKATLNWTTSTTAGAPVTYKLRTKGPQGTTMSTFTTGPVVQQNLQVDATYEYTLEPVNACSRSGGTSVRLVRLSDTTPPTMPIVMTPTFNPVAHVVGLSWVAAGDNVQVDHYEVVRNGVPVGATDSTSFTDATPPQDSDLSYVVRAVDTNGNSTDSAAAAITTPDWTPPTAPVLTVSMSGATATLRWTASTDNIGVVAYDVLRDGKQIAGTSPSLRVYKDVAVPVGEHAWQVRARDDQGLSALSAAQKQRVAKSSSRVSVVGSRLAGHGKAAAIYSLKARERLLVDLHVFGTIAKAKLRLHVKRGHSRITVWRGTPGSSAPRTRLGSAVSHAGVVSVTLARTLHTGRIRLVLIASGKVVVVGKGSQRPAVKAG
ncbi:MAG TPA: hypothetical protein VHZ31_01050 [Solirubrobacteraceae bacterium]|nr:hypothetical protein [Solirubrobacteraceae bacterium]